MKFPQTRGLRTLLFDFLFPVWFSVLFHKRIIQGFYAKNPKNACFFKDACRPSRNLNFFPHNAKAYGKF
jgi:hypothetical protein